MQTNYNNLSIFNAPALNSSFGASTEIKSTSNSGTTLKRKTRVGARNRNFVPSRNLGGTAAYATHADGFYDSLHAHTCGKEFFVTSHVKYYLDNKDKYQSLYNIVTSHCSGQSITFNIRLSCDKRNLTRFTCLCDVGDFFSFTEGISHLTLDLYKHAIYDEEFLDANPIKLNLVEMVILEGCQLGGCNGMGGLYYIPENEWPIHGESGDPHPLLNLGENIPNISYDMHRDRISRLNNKKEDVYSKMEAIVNRMTGKRHYTTSSRNNNKIDINQTNLLSLKQYFENINYLSNESVQTEVEIWLQNNEITNRSSDSRVFGLTTDIFDPRVSEVLAEVRKDMFILIGRLTDVKEAPRLDIFKTLSPLFLYNTLAYNLLVVMTHSKMERDVNSDDVNDHPLYITPFSISIGKSLVREFFRIKKEESGSNTSNYKQWEEKFLEDNPEYKILKVSDELYCNLGSALINILNDLNLTESKLIRKKINNQIRRFWRIFIRHPILEKISQKPHLFVEPRKLPMIVPPREYRYEDLGGGYLLNNKDYYEDLFTSEHSFREGASIRWNNKVCTLATGLSHTPFRINIVLWNFINSEAGRKLGLLTDESILEQYEGTGKGMKKKYTALQSKIFQEKAVWQIVDTYKGFNKIYFPVRMDQRGRVYPTPEYFHYQASELAKSLLLFAIPAEIKKGGDKCMDYLSVFGANCFGGSISKQSINNKVNWVVNHKADILNYENGTLLKRAKLPYLFLAFCIEYKRYIDFLDNSNADTFYHYQPVQIDATCNGFQHIAMLSEEKDIFEYLNLKIGKSEKNKALSDIVPGDFYNYILNKAKLELENKIKQDKSLKKEELASYNRLYKFNWGRSHVKKIVMTIPYNATPFSMKNYLLEELVEVKFDEKTGRTYYSDGENDKNLISFDDAYKFVILLNTIIKNNFAHINKLLSYLNSVVAICEAVNVPINWSLPTGLEISQSYLEKYSIGIKPFPYLKTTVNLQVMSKDQLDFKKQKVAFMPNFIHSLDAASLGLLYHMFSDLYKNSSQFYAVHDCFGTTCDKVDVMKEMLRSVYVKLYTQPNYIYKFDEGIRNFISSNTHYKWEGRNLILDDNTVIPLQDIDWVINNKLNDRNYIDAQNLAI